MSTRAEQETVITYTAADDCVQIYSCIPRDIRRFGKRENCELLEQGRHSDGTEFARFRVALEHWKADQAVRPTVKRTAAQLEAAARSLPKAHATPTASGESGREGGDPYPCEGEALSLSGSPSASGKNRQGEDVAA